jgi:cell wall-associated NlpC family hydrolase
MLGARMRILALILMAAATLACASTGAMPRPFPTPGGGTPPTTPAEPPIRPPTPIVPPDGNTPDSPDGYALAGTALALRGVPYQNGGVTPSGFDCSGLVQYVFSRYGLAVPREVRDQYRLGQRVDRDRLEPGDLVFFSTVARGASHVGIALGGDQFVHAPSSTGVVRVEQLSAPYWASRFVGARRINRFN